MEISVEVPIKAQSSRSGEAEDDPEVTVEAAIKINMNIVSK